MSREPDATKPPDLYAWTCELPDQNGRVQEVALCATLDGQPPSPLVTPDLRTAMSLEGAAQQAANALQVEVRLHAYRGKEAIQVLKPSLIEKVLTMPSPPHHN